MKRQSIIKKTHGKLAILATFWPHLGHYGPKVALSSKPGPAGQRPDGRTWLPVLRLFTGLLHQLADDPLLQLHLLLQCLLVFIRYLPVGVDEAAPLVGEQRRWLRPALEADIEYTPHFRDQLCSALWCLPWKGVPQELQMHFPSAAHWRPIDTKSIESFLFPFRALGLTFAHPGTRFSHFWGRVASFSMFC